MHRQFLNFLMDLRKLDELYTPTVIGELLQLFKDCPALLRGFDAFPRPRHTVEGITDDSLDAVVVQTPRGMLTWSIARTSLD
jgi:histone deacetylase complex regulatory component SIN3